MLQQVAQKTIGGFCLFPETLMFLETIPVRMPNRPSWQHQPWRAKLIYSWASMPFTYPLKSSSCSWTCQGLHGSTMVLIWKIRKKQKSGFQTWCWVRCTFHPIKCNQCFILAIRHWRDVGMDFHKQMLQWQLQPAVVEPHWWVLGTRQQAPWRERGDVSVCELWEKARRLHNFIGFIPVPPACGSSLGPCWKNDCISWQGHP